MKYFEVKQPYYALLKAENEEEAKKLYNEIVADEDEFSQAHYTEITEEEAWKKYSDPRIKSAFEGEAEEQMKENFYDKVADMLLVDGDLV